MNELLESHFQASLAGNKESFGELVVCYQGLVCSVTYSITGNIETSEDLAQETFVTAWQHLAELRDWRKLPAWLCGIARNLARNDRRRRSKDPLHRAGELDAEHPSGPENFAELLGKNEREAIVWRTLATIPEEYREPLIMFYREGQSVRAVAEALDITEDNARQRLSRGRKMLKEQVARIVEDSLGATRPGTVFTVAVLAALPVMTAQSAVAGGVVAAGKQGATIAAGAGMLGGLLGALVGMTGGFFGMWAGIRNSPTLRVRRFMLKCSALTYAFVWLFLGFEAMSGVLFWQRPTLMLTLAGIGWIIYVPLLFVLIVWSNRVWLRLLEEDLGQRDAPSRPLEKSVLSRRRVWLVFAWSLVAAATGSAGTVLWLYSMPASRPLWPVFAAIVLLCHFIFYMMYRHGVVIARDEQSFNTSPPAISAADTLSLRSGNKVLTARSVKTLFWNDFAALAGGIFGPMMPLLATAVEARDYFTAGLIVLVSVCVLLGAIVLRGMPEMRRWAFFHTCMFMGVFSSGVIAMKWRAWTDAGILGLPDYIGAWSAAIPLALYWCIGLALLFTIPRHTSK